MRAASRSRIMMALVLSFTQNSQLPPGVFQKLEKVFAQENLAAAQGEDENAGIGHLFEQMLDLGRGHLPVIVMIEIAVHAALVAAVSEVELHAERNVARQRFFGHLLQKSDHRDPPEGFAGAGFGC